MPGKKQHPTTNNPFSWSTVDIALTCYSEENSLELTYDENKHGYSLVWFSGHVMRIQAPEAGWCYSVQLHSSTVNDNTWCDTTDCGEHRKTVLFVCYVTMFVACVHVRVVCVCVCVCA